MSKSSLLALIVTLVPAAFLAVWATRHVNRTAEDALAEIATQLTDDAGEIARRVEAAVAGAIASKEEQEAIWGYRHEDGTWNYRSTPVSRVAASDEDRMHYELSRRGGEAFEFRERQYDRAVDAYAFYLPRLESSQLRDRLRLAIARCAVRGPHAEVGRELLRSLLRDSKARTEEGFPVALAAGLLLSSLSQDAEHAVEETRAWLHQHADDFSTHDLAAFARLLTPIDSALSQVITRRRRLEAAVENNPEIRHGRSAILLSFGLLRRLESVEGPIPGFELIPVAVRSLVRGSTVASIDSATEAGSTAEGVVSRPLRAGGGGPVIASLHATNPTAEARREEIRQGHRTQLALLAVVVVILVAAAVALTVAAHRQRSLALLRARLVANVSHELKTPITSMRIFSEMLAGDDLEEEQVRRFGAMLTAESRRLSQLVENLLDFSRDDDSLPPPRRERLNLAALLRPLAESFSFRAVEEGVQFETDLPEAVSDDAPLEVDSDPAAIERITLNLLDNAMKYRDAESPRVALVLRREGNGVCVDVRDNGPGVPRVDRERIFEEFYRSRFDDYAVQGTGLGLAISRKLARRLGGDISLRSGKNQGCVFTLALPGAETTGSESAEGSS